MPAVSRLQPPRYNFGVFPMQGMEQYTLLVDQNHMTGEVTISLYLEIHHQVDGLTAEAVEAAHANDLEVQARYGVKYLKSWFDERRNKVFCLMEAPSKEAAIAVRRETHNLVADEVIEIR